MKIISVVGARPQFVKLAPLLKELGKYSYIKHIILHTGQHYDYNMSKIFFDELGIPEPEYHLGVGSGTHAYQTAEIMKKCEDVFLKEKADCVIVFGDTNSTLGAALAASKLNIKIAHIEAGLRSYNKKMPEEINRVVTDHISDILFPPTLNAKNILELEGLKENVYLVGDIMIDAIKNNISKAEKRIKYNKVFNFENKKYFLVTIHRQYNTDKKESLERIINLLGSLNNLIIWPIHPRTKKKILDFNLEKVLNTYSNIKIIEPLGYFEMLLLEKYSEKIITDSGGIQKEAYFFKVPCITLRSETEWIETVESGWNILVDLNKVDLEMAKNIILNQRKPKKYDNVFGNGNASQKILKVLKEKV